MRSTLLLLLFTAIPNASAFTDARTLTSIQGILEDESGKPIARAIVEARSFDDSRKATTDAEGRFEVKTPVGWNRGLYLLSSAAEGKKLAYHFVVTEAEWRKQPIRLRMKPARRALDPGPRRPDPVTADG